MPGIEQLQFAQRFPFSSAAKRFLKESGLKLDSVGEEVLNRAAIMISHAAAGKDYVIEIGSSDLLEQEITAFPIAKILISLMKEPQLYKSFSSMVSKSSFNYIEKSADRKQLSLDLAKDLGIEFELAEEKSFFVLVPIRQFLSIKFNDPTLKLVHQTLHNGKVLLNINLFCRFIAELIFLRVFESLPVEMGEIPASFKPFARQLSTQVKRKQFEEFNFKVEGKVNANLFSPCIASLYKQQIEGGHLPHMARFFLASFLNAVGMTPQQILMVFKKSPNFDEKIASYQIRRIAEQNYSPASCEKIKSYGLCKETDCRVKHPLSYYRRMLRASRAEKQKNKFS